MKLLHAIPLVLLLLVLLVVAIGALLPKEHVASRSVTLDASLEQVWALVIDHQAFPSWRGDLLRVEARSETSGRRAWLEVGKRNQIPYVADREVLDGDRAELVTRIDDPALPFGGTWTWAFERAGAQTRLTITEHGFVGPPVFRFMSRFVFGHTASLDAMVQALERRTVK